MLDALRFHRVFRPSVLWLPVALAFGLAMSRGAAATDLTLWSGAALGRVTSTAARADGSILVDAESLGHARFLGETSTILRYTVRQGTDAAGRPISTAVGDATLHAENGDKVYITFQTLERMTGAPPFLFTGHLTVAGGTGRFVGASGQAGVLGLDNAAGKFAYFFLGKITAPGKGTPPPPPDVVDDLKVPAGNVVLFHALGTGVQIYECRATGWTFVAPRADLLDEAGKKIGIHYAGPTWESLGGSKVVAARVAGSSPDAMAIPWLRLVAVSNDGAGALSAVTHIQRVNTTGGLAPTTACGPAEVGTIVEVPYTAQYYFYGATQ